MSTHRRALATAILALIAGCSSLPRPGTGDLTFRLRWTGKGDLDLYVISPADERIDFTHREVASGGRLDFDCNVTRSVVKEPPVENANDTSPTQPPLYQQVLCEPPIENVFWPRGRALEGEYRFSVFLANPDGATDQDIYRFQVLVGGRPRIELEGEVRRLLTEPLMGIVELPLPKQAPLFQPIVPPEPVPQDPPPGNPP